MSAAGAERLEDYKAHVEVEIEVRAGNRQEAEASAQALPDHLREVGESPSIDAVIVGAGVRGLERGWR